MQFHKHDDATIGGDALLDRLTGELEAGKRVLWLLTGGSGLSLCVRLMAALPTDLTKNLTVALTDERYGPIGHADSNWQQMLDIGFEPKQARAVPTLVDDSYSLEQAAEAYEQVLHTLLDEAEVVIGVFGMGSDGHTAGILPGSPAVVAPGLVVGYVSTAYQRITMTFDAIKRCDAAYLFAFGEAKLTVLQNLRTDLPVAEQPAQILKQVPESYVYNDQIGDNE